MGHWDGSEVETYGIPVFLQYFGDFSKEQHEESENSKIDITPN